MAQKEELKKHTLNLRQGDFDYLEGLFVPRGISTAFGIRRIISTYVDKMRIAEANAAPDSTLETHLGDMQ